MGKSQRTKGATYEREIVRALMDALGIAVERNLNQTRDGGGDIDLPGYLVECKRRAGIAVYEWLDQATRAAKPNQTPLVIARADRRESIVIMRLDDFLPLLQGAQHAKTTD
jgi:hypothetical protein